MREQITKRMAEPPPAIASLSDKDQRALRDILKRALESAPDADLPEDAAVLPAGAAAAK
jgi:hypothetical protein